MSVKILNPTTLLGLELGRIPVRVRGLAWGPATFAGIGSALDHVEEEVIFVARRICGLRRVVGLMLKAKPALGVDLNRAFRCVAPKMKVQTHRETPPSSPDASHFVHGPVSEDGLAVDVALPDWTEVTAVIRQAAVITQHEIAIGGNHYLSVRSLVLVGSWHIVFVDRLAIHKDAAGIDLDMVTRQANHPLDKALRWVSGIAEHDDVTALDRLQPINKLVHEDPFLIFERGHHACAFHFHRLVEEDDDETRNGQRDDQITQPDGEHHGARWRGNDWLAVVHRAAFRGVRLSGHNISNFIRIGLPVLRMIREADGNAPDYNSHGIRVTISQHLGRGTGLC